MSTTPALDPTQQPPIIQDQAYNPHSGHTHGSVGPVIGVLAVIMVLCAIAVMIGRLCSGRRVMGHLQYDFEGWVETKCSTCIDGRMGPPPRRQTVPVVVVERNVSSDENGAAPVPAESPEITAGERQPHVEEVTNQQQQEQVEQQHSKHES